MKNIGLNLLLCLFSILLTLLIMEAASRTFFPSKMYYASSPKSFFIQHDPEIGWTNKKDISGPYYTPNTTEPVFVRTNSFGQRGGSVNLEKTGGKKRILILGDSNAFGYAIKEENMFSSLLSEQLSASYEVINSSVFGYGTDQQLLLLKREGLRFNPDIVLIAFSAGDLSENMFSIDGGYSKPYFKLSKGELILKNTPVPKKAPYRRSESKGSILKNLLYKKSHLYRLIFQRLASSHPFMVDSVQEMDNEEGMLTTVALLNEIKKVCRENNSHLIVMLIPHGQIIDAASRLGRINIGYFPDLKKRLALEGISFLDTTEALTKARMKGKAVFFENDPVHLSNEGNKITSHTFKEWFLARYQNM